MRYLTRPGLAIAGAFLALFLASSCGPRLGWGLLLWTDQEAGLHAGAVVPVYIRSNIEKKYIIGVPESKRKDEVPLWQLELFTSKRAAEKARLSFGNYLTSYLFANRDGLPVRDAPTNVGRRVYRLREGQSVKILAEVQGDVVKSGTEALPGSWFKVLAEDGTQGYVFSNTMRMYDELTESPPSIAQAGADDAGRSVDLVFSRTWRGEYFQTMIDDGRIDLDTFNARYGLFADAMSRQIRIELPSTSQVFNYSSIAQSGQDFLFEGTPLRIRFDGENRLIADWSGLSADNQGGGSTQQAPMTGPSGPSPTSPQVQAPQGGKGQSGSAGAPSSSPLVSPSAAAPAGDKFAGGGSPSGAPNAASTPQRQGAGASGTPTSPGGGSGGPAVQSQAQGQAPPSSLSPGAANATQAVFVVLSQDIREVIRGEENRRINLLGHFVDQGSVWVLRPEASNSPSAAAPPAGSRLSIFRAGRFSWTAIESVPAVYLGTDLGDVVNGTASGEATVRLDLDPSLTGSWEGALSLRFDGTREWLDFLYRHEEGRLLLQPVASGGVRDLVVMTAGNLAALSFDGSK